MTWAVASATLLEADESAAKLVESFLALTFEATTIWAVLLAISWEAAISSSNLPCSLTTALADSTRSLAPRPMSFEAKIKIAVSFLTASKYK